MKKNLILSAFLLMMITGCGAGATNTMSCTYNTTNGNIATKMKYDIDYQDSDVKKVRITYDYSQLTNQDNTTDGVGTGTDGTTNDTQIDNDGIIDGVVGNGIDSIVLGVTDVILDIAGLKDRHMQVQNTYGNINGFSVQNTTDTDNNYKVTYVIDYDNISDTDLSKLNLSRNIDTLKNNYVSQGYTCE